MTIEKLCAECNEVTDHELMFVPNPIHRLRVGAELPVCVLCGSSQTDSQYQRRCEKALKELADKATETFNLTI